MYKVWHKFLSQVRVTHLCCSSVFIQFWKTQIMDCGMFPLPKNKGSEKEPL